MAILRRIYIIFPVENIIAAVVVSRTKLYYVRGIFYFFSHSVCVLDIIGDRYYSADNNNNRKIDNRYVPDRRGRVKDKPNLNLEVADGRTSGLVRCILCPPVPIPWSGTYLFTPLIGKLYPRRPAATSDVEQQQQKRKKKISKGVSVPNESLKPLKS